MAGEAPRRIPILLVQGDEPRADALADVLAQTGVASRIVPATGAAAALAAVAEHRFGAIFMDVAILDAAGLTPVADLRAAAPGTPIIVVSDTDDPERAAASVAAGAQDYVVRGELNGLSARRVLRCAIERQRRERQLEQRRQRRGRRREIGRIEEISSPLTTSLTARLFGVAPLKEGFQQHFRAFVAEYRDLLEAMVEERTFRVDRGVMERTRALARQLGMLHASARDVMELHTSALREHLRGAGRRGPTIMDEGRLLALQLMGHLVAFYRGGSSGPGSSRREDTRTGRGPGDDTV